jgi:hypothetical protein
MGRRRERRAEHERRGDCNGSCHRAGPPRERTTVQVHVHVSSCKNNACELHAFTAVQVLSENQNQVATAEMRECAQGIKTGS